MDDEVYTVHWIDEHYYTNTPRIIDTRRKVIRLLPNPVLMDRSPPLPLVTVTTPFASAACGPALGAGVGPAPPPPAPPPVCKAATCSKGPLVLTPPAAPADYA
jgi:hypothetical protein